MGKLHHLSVGCADCSVIVNGGATYLIDCSGIGDHSELLPKGKKLRAVFITHQHYDHFDGLGYLKDEGYLIEYLVHAPYERRRGDASVSVDEWNDFAEYRDYFKDEGTKVYAPYRQADFEEPWWDQGAVKFFMLGPTKEVAESDIRELHDASLVVHAKLGDKRRCLFTGDASDASLGGIAECTKNMCGDILHASHHGSLLGADLGFVKKCAPQYTVVSTKSGVYENVPSDIGLRRYRDHTAVKVYRTDVDGNLSWSF